MPIEELALYRAYSRKQIHDLFEPETPFTPQAGSWGLHGIVRLARRPGDFVLMVTFGRAKGSIPLTRAYPLQAYCAGNHRRSRT
jgi:hypothetical protein